jgi:endogenous inhibitor of DNA gyrase (YacG/DUF329 family)
MSTRIARCPRCGASSRLDGHNPWRPFCSERCKLIDLGDWLDGRNAIPGEPVGDVPVDPDPANTSRAQGQ